MKYAWVRTIYLYVVSLVTLMMMIFSASQLVNMALKVWVFPEAGKVEEAQMKGMPSSFYPGRIDEKTGAQTIIDCKEKCGFSDDQKKQAEAWLSDYEQWKKNSGNTAGQRQLEAVRALSMLLVSIPVFWYHWLLIGRERKEKMVEKEHEKIA